MPFAISLLLLTACDSGRHERMREELFRAREMNKEYIDFTTDSVMKEVADYYDRHGTPNERMEAHYLLGCTYRDMGEAPRAIDCYLDAVACADTTAADCDFWMMASVYGQMATLYHQQLLLSYEIEAYRQAYRYNLLSSDTLSSLCDQKMMAGAYILQNKKDSAELIIKNTIHDYRKLGNIEEEIKISTMLMYLYVDRLDKLSESKHLMDRYEAMSDYFDDRHELKPSKRIYYFYKGKYYENMNMPDSAEYYYRKIYRPGMSFTEYDPIYKGLLSVFRKTHQADSIAKYAQLYCAVNDSSIAIKDQELTAQMASSYQYSHYQKQALDNEKKANKARESLLFVIILAFIISSIVYLIWRRYKNIQQKKYDELIRLQKIKQEEIERLTSEFSAITNQYNKNKQTLHLLEESHRIAISSTQDKLDNAKNVISELNHNIELFKKENDSLKEKLEELGRHEEISTLMERAKCFAATPIVIRVMELAEKPELRIYKKDWEELSSVISNFYPNLLKDLNGIPNVTTQEIQTTFLVILNIRTDDIARLLNVSGQRITNIKASLNDTLFGMKSARTFYENMKKRYGIYLLDY